MAVPMYCPHPTCRWSYDASTRTGDTYLATHLRVVHRGQAAPPPPATALPRLADRPSPRPTDRPTVVVTAAARPAGPPRPKKIWTRDRIIERIQERAAELGRPPSSNEIERAMVNACAREFGSWSIAVEEAGYRRHEKPGRPRKTARVTA